jgi:hypothetical protein
MKLIVSTLFSLIGLNFVNLAQTTPDLASETPVWTDEDIMYLLANLSKSTEELIQEPVILINITMKLSKIISLLLIILISGCNNDVHEAPLKPTTLDIIEKLNNGHDFEFIKVLITDEQSEFPNQIIVECQIFGLLKDFDINDEIAHDIINEIFNSLGSDLRNSIIQVHLYVQESNRSFFFSKKKIRMFSYRIEEGRLIPSFLKYDQTIY